MVYVGAGEQVDQRVVHGPRCRHQGTVAVAYVRTEVMSQAIEDDVVQPVAKGVELPRDK